MGIELEQLRQIAAIEEYGTLSSAAAALNISQPALSRSMQRIEDDLCVRLFDRSKNHMEFNANGRLLLTYAHRILDMENEMTRSVRDFDRSSRTITIGTCAPAPLWYLLPVLSGLFPDMAVSTELGTTEDVLSGFRNHTFQLAILPYECREAALTCKHLIDEQLFFSLPKFHPLAGRKALHMSDLDGEDILLFSGIGFWYQLHKEKMPHTRFLMQSERTAFQTIAKASTLPCFASDLSIGYDHDDTDRVIIPILDPESHAHFYCVCRKEDDAMFRKLFLTFPLHA